MKKYFLLLLIVFYNYFIFSIDGINDNLKFVLLPDKLGYEVSAINENISGDVYIPANFLNYPVTKISDFAFSFCEKIEKIVLPDTITVIGKGAFSPSSIIGITLLEGIRYIDDFSFVATNLKYIQIPSTVEYIGYTAFGVNSDDLVVEILKDESISKNWHPLWNWVTDIENQEGRTINVVWSPKIKNIADDNKRIITVQKDSRYRTVDNLRLRSAEETSSDILSTLEKGTIVTVLSLGKEDTIDGIQSHWVKVQLEDGTTGWCFGGYLLPSPIEVTNSYKSTQTKEANQAKGSNQNKDTTKKTFAGVTNSTLVVGGGVLVLLLGAGIFLLLKRKK